MQAIQSKSTFDMCPGSVYMVLENPGTVPAFGQTAGLRFFGVAAGDAQRTDAWMLRQALRFGLLPEPRCNNSYYYVRLREGCVH